MSRARAKHWCFTLNNYESTDISRITSLEGSVDYLVFGKEVSSTGTPHLQGFVSFKDRIRVAACIEKVGQAHFTVARDINRSIEYCKKDGDFVEFGVRPVGQGARNDLEEFKAAVVDGELNMAVLRARFSEVVAKFPKFAQDFVRDHVPKKQVPLHPLRVWQQTLYTDLQRVPDQRSIVFCVDLVGNTGKSWFCHYYCQLNANAQVLLPGKKADMAYCLKYDSRVIFFDAPRSKQGEFIQYDFLEDLKNGYVMSPKYESNIICLQDVHVVVMMNEHPDMTKLSADRYDVRVLV